MGGGRIQVCGGAGRPSGTAARTSGLSVSRQAHQPLGQPRPMSRRRIEPRPILVPTNGCRQWRIQDGHWEGSHTSLLEPQPGARFGSSGTHFHSEMALFLLKKEAFSLLEDPFWLQKVSFLEPVGTS